MCAHLGSLMGSAQEPLASFWKKRIMCAQGFFTDESHANEINPKP